MRRIAPSTGVIAAAHTDLDRLPAIRSCAFRNPPFSIPVPAGSIPAPPAATPSRGYTFHGPIGARIREPREKSIASRNPGLA